MSEFVWTETLIMEYARYVAESYSKSEQWTGDFTAEQSLMDKFKKAKQPKPEWEILEGINDKGYVFRWAKNHPHFMDDIIGVTGSIHSVKRLSDGEVFTVGDIVTVCGLSSSKPIKGFKVQMGAQKALVCFHPESDTYLDYLKHARQTTIPVLLTPAQIEKLKTLLND